MLYLLDASVLITANNSYYPVDRVPEYWDWLRHIAEQGQVKIPIENFEEIKDGPDDEEKDLLFAWMQQDGWFGFEWYVWDQGPGLAGE